MVLAQLPGQKRQLWAPAEKTPARDASRPEKWSLTPGGFLVVSMQGVPEHQPRKETKNPLLVSKIGSAGRVSRIWVCVFVARARPAKICTCCDAWSVQQHTMAPR